MKRIDIVKKRLTELSAEHGVTANELAFDLRLSRANVSSDLNRLFKDGKVEKYGTKPVYYRILPDELSQNAEMMLNAFVKRNQSLSRCVEEAKAAVLYPPHGMNVLLLGDTGVGKSMFAELIYQYAREKGCLSGNAPFVDFNCADYADNPQLLVSQLMGTKKGAYTGADADRAGLIEEADGGILFLDEVHRLPPQGQEMLFTFMDKGTYRRLGETKADRSAGVLIICATTENPGSSLLKTFVRRIPMIIKIPNLDERSTDERLNLISHFFCGESARLGKPVSVSVNSIRSLLSYHCPNNIGQLKNDIQIICAKAYSNYVSGKKDELSVVSTDLPHSIREGLFSETSHREIWNRYASINKRFYVFDSRSEKELFFQREDGKNIYDMIDRRMEELKSENADENRIADELEHDIDLFFQKYLTQKQDIGNFQSLKNLVGMDIIYATDEILALAGKELTREFKHEIRYALALHIYNMIDRLRRGRRILNPQFNNIRKKLPKEFTVALNSLKLLNKKFGIDIPIDEAGFLAVFFNIDLLKTSAKVAVVVITHGASTASSMAAAANSLLEIGDGAVGIDAALDESPQEVYLRLKTYLADCPVKSGLLLLVDMGSLMSFAEKVEKDFGIDAKSIPLVSTLHVIEAARMAALGYSLSYIYKQTRDISQTALESDPLLPVKEHLAKIFVVSICTTGEGSAALIKNILDSQLDYHNAMCETITMRLTDAKSISERLNAIAKIGRIICVVSSFPIAFPAAHFSLLETIEQKAIPKIQKLIDEECMLENISDTFSRMLHNVDGDKVLRSACTALKNIERESDLQLIPDVQVGILCHLGCMVDRLVSKQPIVEFPEGEPYIKANRDFFIIVRHSFDLFEENFGIFIPDDEICRIASFFTPRNCLRNNKLNENL